MELLRSLVKKKTWQCLGTYHEASCDIRNLRWDEFLLNFEINWSG